MSGNRTARLKTNLNELTKSHAVYDGSGRMTDLYECHTDTTDGGDCIRTTYTYDGTSGRIVGRKETNATWDSSWDI